MRLPAPSPDALAFSDALKRRIIDEIEAADGWIGFDRFMELALYAPGMGYYSGGAQKFGAAGDFVTAPEISSAFSQTLATQAIQIMALSAPQIVEVGAGSGRLAADLLLELERLDNALQQVDALLSGALPRMKGYGRLHREALHRVRLGGHEWLDGPDRASCQLVWIQLHEDLLATLGIVIGMILAYGINQMLMGKYELPRLPLLYLPVGAAASSLRKAA